MPYYVTCLRKRAQLLFRTWTWRICFPLISQHWFLWLQKKMGMHKRVQRIGYSSVCDQYCFVETSIIVLSIDRSSYLSMLKTQYWWKKIPIVPLPGADHNNYCIYTVTVLQWTDFLRTKVTSTWVWISQIQYRIKVNNVFFLFNRGCHQFLIGIIM